MTSALPAPDPCPSFLPVFVKDMSAKTAGSLTTYFLDCGMHDGHDNGHRSANGTEWSSAEGRQKQ